MQSYSKSLLSLCFIAFAWGCSEANEIDPVDHVPTKTVEAKLVDIGEPNWMVGGNEGLVEMLGGGDGEPDVVTGRFVLDGLAISASSSSADRLIVVGNGKLQVVDSDALRVREVRDALDGNAVSIIERGPVGWLIGGAAGEIQLLDAEGEPSMTTTQLLSGAEVTGAAWNGNSWLIGSAGGRVTTASATLTSGNPNGQMVVGGSPVVSIVTESAPVNGQSTAWFVFSANSYERVTGGGTPQGEMSLDVGVVLTTAEFLLGKVVLGTSDGRFGEFNPTTGTVAWTSAFGAQAVSNIETDGTDFLVLGKNGSARLFDNTLTPKAAKTDLATNRTPVGAWFADGRWLVVIGEVAFVEFVAPDLGALRELMPVLGGADIRDSDAADVGVLVVGTNGKVQLLDSMGLAKSTVATVGDGTTALNAVSWNGEQFLAVGDNGLAQLVGNDGQPVGTALSLLGGADIHFAAWSGQYWLIGGAGGKYARIRADGAISGSIETLNTATSLDAARFNGRAWMLAGTNGTHAIHTLMQPDGTVGTVKDLTNFLGTVKAVEYNGLEWVLGGTGGIVQRLSSEGQIVAPAADVLNGYEISDIYFNGVNYLVSGQFGAVRRLSADGVGLRAPIAAIDQRDAHAVIWTRPRGFAGGICLSNDSCFEGPCVGGVLAGKCCDSACDRACDSCFQDDTGEPDGTCAPVVAGKQPPAGANGCARASESTCGYTGACDGAGECQSYGSDVACGEATCVAGKFTALASCDGSGMCSVPADLDCRPYAGCTPDNGCATACGSSSDCVNGYTCTNSECVEKDDTTVIPKPKDEGGSDDGCTTAMNHQTDHNFWIFAVSMMGLAFMIRRGTR